MTTARIDWTTALGPGATVVPVVLVAGVPVVLTPAGVHPTATAVSSGTIDPQWWPGTGTLTTTRPDASTLDPVHDWLSPAEVWETYETTQPAAGDVKVEPFRFDLVDPAGAATALLSAPNARIVRELAADCAATGNVTISDATGLPSSGVAHIGREALTYSSISSNTLVVASRGAFGSKARVHLAGNGTRAPLVVIGDQPRYWHGRRAAVFLCVLVGTTLYDPTLIYLGTVGAGINVLAKLLRWQIPLDHSTQAMAQKLYSDTVTVWGYEPGQYSFYGYWDNGFQPTTWMANRQSYVNQLQSMSVSLNVGLGFSLQGDNTIDVRNDTSHRNQAWQMKWGWDTGNIPHQGYDNDIHQASPPMPDAFMHLNGYTTLGTAGDYDKVPGTLAYPASPLVFNGAQAQARVCLVAKTDNVDKIFAPILSRDTTNQNAVVLGDPSVWYFDQLRRTAQGPALTRWQTVVSKPTSARLGIVSNGDEPLVAIQALTLAIEGMQGSDLQADSIDWDGISAAFATRPLGGIPQRRSYSVDGDTDTLVNILADECRLRGFTLTVRRGLVSAYRLANLASTEVPRLAITSADFASEGGNPIEAEVVDGLEPTATAIRYTMPDASTYTWRDNTSADEFGEGKVVECKALTNVDPNDVATSAPFVEQLGVFASQLLSVLATPQRVIRIVLPASFYDLDAGDIVALTHEAIPDWSGNRGLSAALCQVLEVRRSFCGGKASVQVALRLASDGSLAGWAPAAFVAAGGVSHVSYDITVDTGTAWGTNGFAPDYDASGNPVTGNLLYGFAVGDAVVLSQMDAESPLTDESFTIINISGTTVTLSAYPTTSMVTAAAGQYGVALRFASHTFATTHEKPFLYIASAVTGTFGTGDAARQWA